MKKYIQEIDPFNHLITTSTAGAEKHPSLYKELFDDMNVVQRHIYCNMQYAESKKQVSRILYDIGCSNDTAFQTSPNFIGEFGFSANSGVSFQEKDTFGIDLHNSLWSSLFSCSMGPASLWWWHYVDNCRLYKHFKPLLSFCNHLPILSDSFHPYTTATVNGKFLECENGIMTYYMKNAAEDTICGWSQDTAFSYQSLRRLTDSVCMVITIDTIISIDTIESPYPPGYIINTDTSFFQHTHWMFVNNVVLDSTGYLYTMNVAKRPQPSSNNNTIKIPIENMSVGTPYKIQWYDSETGSVFNFTNYTSVQVDPQGNKCLFLSFPAIIRNLTNNVINNTFGDVVFLIVSAEEEPHPNEKIPDK